MNRVSLLFLFVFGFQSLASAASGPFQNDSLITSVVQLPQESSSFVNRGRIQLSLAQPYELNTLNFTNIGNAPYSGYMSGYSGFWFNWSPDGAVSRSWMSSFFNGEQAQIQAQDYTLPADYLPRSIIGHSLLRIWSTNVITGGGSAGSNTQPGSRASLIVGANGLLDIRGNYVDLSRSGLEVLPVWNESSGSANDLQNGVFTPDLAVDDLASVTGSFGNPPNSLNVDGLWDGQTAQSVDAPPSGQVVVPAFVLDAPEGDYYFKALPNSDGRSSAGFVVLTNYAPLTFTTNNFVPTQTNSVVVTNVVVVPASYFETNAVFTTNLAVLTYIQALNTVSNLATQYQAFSFTNVFYPFFAFTTTNVVLTTNTMIEGNVFSAVERTTSILVVSNSVKGAFFGQAPSGFVISHGFAGGNATSGRTIQATVSTLISNAVTGVSDVASVLVQDTLASATDRGVLDNTLTSQFPPEPATTRPVNYIVSRGAVFSGVITGTNVTGITNIITSSINRLPAANFFTTAGIRDPNNTLFFDTRNTTSDDSVDRSFVIAGDYSGYSANFDNIVEREPDSPFATETNRTGSVNINAQRLNLQKTRIRGEGVISISTPHLISSSNAVIDCESLSFDLASTNGTLRFQNLSKDQVQRLRGTITVWSAIWSNSVSVVFNENYSLTNGTITITNAVGTNEVVRTNLIVQQAPFTNTISVMYHTMMLDARDLTLTVPVSVYDMALRSPNVVFDDYASVVRSFFTSARSFTLNGDLRLGLSTSGILSGGTLSSGLPLKSWLGTNAPNLAMFTNNGSLRASRELHFGDDRSSPYAAFVNNGIISAETLQLKSTYFENSGMMLANDGPLDVQSRNGRLTGGTNASTADLTFSGENLDAIDALVYSESSVIFSLTNRLSDLGEISQFRAGNGFHLLTKPLTGDFLASSFFSIAPDVPAARPVHRWAGEDRGSSAAGFSNNAAIGYLLLDSDIVSGAAIDPVFEFSPVGVKNALYVDVLDLSALDDLDQQLLINPGFTIYYAAAILPFTPPDIDGIPQTPEEYLDGKFEGRLRWVPTFAGPNSSTTVIIDGMSVAVNSGLANQWANNGIDPSTVIHLAPVTIEINGNGSVSPFTNSQPLIIGQTNTVVAIPGPGATFLGWTGTFETNTPQLTFVADADVVLIANFTFTPSAATYNGLFYTTNAIEFLKSGAISVTTTKSGKYSGSVQYGAKKYSFTGMLDEAGADSRSIPNSPLYLEFQTGTDHITGTIGDGDWLADLYMDRAVYNAKTNPAPFKGQYTLLFPGSGSATNSELPFGDGYGTVTIDAAGKVRLSGSMADGTKISQSSVVTGDRHWPLYIPLYKGQGQLLSWQTVADTGDKDIGGDYSWIKPADDRSKVYPDGFAFQTNAFGSFYNTALSPITGFEDALLILSGGDLITNLQTGVFVTNKVYAIGTNKFSMTLNVPTGTFKGATVNPATGKPINFTGVVLQKQGYGSGYFLSTNQTSGKVTVIPTP